MNTQDRKNRAGWLSLGWLTDTPLVRDLKAYQTRRGAPMSQCVREALRAGLDALAARR